MKRIAEAGKIDAQGRLLLPMERVNQFAGQNKGARVLVTIEAAEPGSSVMQQAYYYKYIVPCVVDALREQGTRMTEERADDFLLRQYPADTENALSGGKYAARRLTRSQMTDFLEWLVQYAAENLETYIEDPHTL